MRPITLRIDIRPAGIILPVRKNFGTNCAARTSETINAVVSPIARCCGRSEPAMSSKTPVIEPAIMDGMLPAFT